MTEIDFDELDQAVGAAMGKPVAQPAAPSPAAPVPVTVTPSAAPTPTASVNVPPRRSSGRFMDVVHPSSDMRPATPAPAPTSVVAPAPVANTPAVIDSSWPSAPVTPEPTPAPALVPPSEAGASPFLEDTKVEKRPLGAYSLNEPAALAKADTEAEASTPMPPELQSDILHIESDSTLTASPDTVPPSEATIPTSTPLAMPAHPDAPATASETTSVFHAAATAPLAHPAKKKSGWVWVIWIVGLLVVGGGIGAAVYFFVLPML